jgi:hypothetical protein
MFKKITAFMVAALMLAQPVAAQLNLNFTTFTGGQTISASQFTENFTNISNKALNRTGGTATGTITFSSGAEFDGSFTIGSTDLQPFDSTGKLKEISSTYFASVSGANLTGLLEANIADGSVFPRLAATETIAGTWTFSSPPVLSGASITSGTIPETALADGSLYARVGSTETITAAWTFSTAPTLAGTNITSLPETAITDGSILARVAANESISGTWTWSNPLKAADGEGANPTFTFSGDDDTGMFRSAANTIAFSADSQTRFLISGSSITTTLQLRVTDGTVSDPAIVPSTDQNTGIYFGGSDDMYLVTNGAARLTANNSGVTIGTLAVSGDLTVSGTITGSLTANQADLFSATDPASGLGYSFVTSTTSGMGLDGGDLILQDRGETLLKLDSAANTITIGAADNGVTINVTSTVLPPASDAFSLGSAGSQWQNIFLVNSPTVSSDRRAKMDIKALETGMAFINQLKPVEYRYVKQPKKLQYGFIAQDLQALGFVGVNADDKDNLGLNYDALIAPMVVGMQEMDTEIHNLGEIVNLQQKTISALLKRIIDLEKGYGGRMKAD